MDGAFFYYFIFDPQNYVYFGDLLSVRALCDGYNLKKNGACATHQLSILSMFPTRSGICCF